MLAIFILHNIDVVFTDLSMGLAMLFVFKVLWDLCCDGVANLWFAWRAPKS